MESTIKHIIINAEIPKGVTIGDLSRKYPETSFNITNGHWISEDERILYITAKNWKPEFFLFLKKHPALIKIDRIGNIIKIHIQSTFLKNFEQKEMTILYPTTLKNGEHIIEFLINMKQFESLKKGLSNIKVLKIADSYKTKANITERQEEILWKAYSFGFYKYPREITLTDLAILLKISKATLSQTLRTVENKAIKQFLEK
ncbi:MAG: helix-turn-helix domain-containing protein [Methanosarcinales archaeon]|nr:helix-turn-helix domain-containing protein [Methanosarcinales archaeon]